MATQQIQVTLTLKVRKTNGGPQTEYQIRQALVQALDGYELYVDDGSHRPSGTYRVSVAHQGP